MIDYLILLLSTDWFLPFWKAIGIDINDEVTVKVREECRLIVGSFMGDVGDYCYIDLREERRQHTYQQFHKILSRYGIDTVLRLGDSEAHKDALSIGIMLRYLTHDIQMETNSHQELDDSIRLAVKYAEAIETVDEFRFSNISRESTSNWDRYVSSIFPDTPDTISTFALFLVQRQRLSALWRRICEQLSEIQREKLLSCYRASTRSMGVPDEIDLVPRFIKPASGTP